jgi:aspartyl-tRNA(Asn)/glutamyl-tRNA(Gln) amidotransferase subunit B
MGEYILSVGMEVHAELKTESKMFCRDRAEFGGEPNTRISPVSLGLPGTLPVPNRMAIEMVLRTALAFNCKIAMRSVFHRKNYFYPDLPKGFQVSQYEETNPLGYYGHLDIPDGEGGLKKVGIQRIHLEEDTGKLMHLPNGGSGVDYNRAGVPLMEIVSGFPPDINTPVEAREYLVRLRQTLLYLGVCDGKMQEGSLRCEPNISVRPADQEKLGTKTELKNLNSFTSVFKGVEFERERQIAELESGGTINQETRGWNEKEERSYLMRIKEHEQDYRYFTDPDLMPMEFTEEYIESLRATIPELPVAKMMRYQTDLGLKPVDADQLARDPDWAAFFESAIDAGGSAREICVWMNGDFQKKLNETGQGASVTGSHAEGRKVSRITPKHLVELTQMIEKGAISGKIGKEVFEDAFSTGEMPSEIVKAKGLTQISDAGAIKDVVKDVLNENPAQVQQYLSGKEGLIGFLVGQVMKKTQGRANPPLVKEALMDLLEEMK